LAVDFTDKSAYTRTSEYVYDPACLALSPELNGRQDLPNIDGLVASIAKIGQLQPVVIRNNGGVPTLIVGISRWRAILKINKEKLTPLPLKIRCVYFQTNENDGFLAGIAENHFRNATTPLDDAYNCDRLQKWGQTIEQIAETYNESAAWVRGRLKLVTLDPEAKAAVKEGRLKPTAAAHISKLSAEQQREAVKGKGKVKGKDVAKPGGRSLKQLVNAMLKGIDAEALTNKEFEYVDAPRKAVLALAEAVK